MIGLVALALAIVCFARAWNLGANGLDEYTGYAKDPVQGNRVRLWAVLGIALTMFVLMDIFSIFDGP
jgi:hypothetical protein